MRPGGGAGNGAARCTCATAARSARALPELRATETLASAPLPEIENFTSTRLLVSSDPRFAREIARSTVPP